MKKIIAGLAASLFVGVAQAAPADRVARLDIDRNGGVSAA